MHVVSAFRYSNISSQLGQFHHFTFTRPQQLFNNAKENQREQYYDDRYSICVLSLRNKAL
jgi:hypothetical protein